MPFFSKFTKIEYSNHILWRNIYFLYNARLSLYSRTTNCCFLTAAIMPTRLKSDTPPVNLLSTFRGRREFLWNSAGAFSFTTHTNVWAEAGSGSITQEIARRTLTFFFEALKGFTTTMCSSSFNSVPECGSHYCLEFTSVRSWPDWMSLGETFWQTDGEAAAFSARFFLPEQPLTLHSR